MTNILAKTILKEMQEEIKATGNLTKDVEALELAIKALEGTALEVPVQEQFIGKCQYCGKENKISLPKGLKPKFCIECGKSIVYQNNQLF